jgi:hypothetical protein
MRLLLAALFLAVVTAVPVVYLVDSLDSNGTDCNGHGSLMWDILADSAPEAVIVPVSSYLFGCNSSYAALQGAFQYIEQDMRGLPANATVFISVSQGVYLPDLPGDLESVFENAWLRNSGATVVASAGNEGLADCTWPASQPGVYAAVAVTERGAPIAVSNFCARKNRSSVLLATACSTSVATARIVGALAAGGTLNDSFIDPDFRESRCKPLFWWPWFLAAAVSVLLIIGMGMSIRLIYLYITLP